MMNKQKKKILVAMSGGVDSSVAAHLLKEQGFDVAGVTMCFGLKEAGRKRPACCGAEAMEDAKKVCLKLKIPHYALDFSKYLKEKVIDRFVAEYASGKTPNPCIDCNKHLKFDILLKKALSMGFDFLATGHYARLEGKGKNLTLKRAKDAKKDQTYFLYSIKRSALKSILFPLGGLTKEKVRCIAREANLPVAEKPASQDICFIPERNYHGFLSDRIKKEVEEGSIINLEGNLLGKHKGACFYTVGQRNGLGIGHRHPLYVVSIDTKKNRLLVGERKDLKFAGLVAGEVNVLAGNLPQKASAKIRYNQKEAKCKLSLQNSGKKLKVVFEKPEEAIAAGQSVVLYKGDTVLGGGVIKEVIKRR